MRWIVWASLIIAACGGHEVVPTPAATRSVSVAPQPAPTAPASPPRLSLRALGLERADCASGPLAACVAAFVDETDVGGDGSWTGPPTCALSAPDDEHHPPTFVDLDGDGTEEVLAYVQLRRTLRSAGRDDPRTTGGFVVLRSGEHDDVLPALAVFENQRVAGDEDNMLEGAQSARVSGTHVLVKGTWGCSDCGCDTIELDFDCTSGACRFAGRHELERAPRDCESP